MNASSIREIFLLSGPTAAGKTELALRWAEEHEAEIVNADALCFYRGMDIGTAKPGPEEQARVPHHLIDICDIDDPCDIRRYLDLAREAVESIHRRGRRVLVVGGSGFYLKSFFEPVTDQLRISKAIRSEVADLFENEGLEGAVERLKALNPHGTGKIDLHNPRRVIPALERCLASGRTVEELQRGFEASPCAFDDYRRHFAWIDRDDGELVARIEQRTASMLEAGLIREVEGLIDRGLPLNPTARTAIGYREAMAFLAGQIESMADLTLQIERNTYRLARKQRKWYASQLVGRGQRFNWSEGNWDTSDLFPLCS